VKYSLAVTAFSRHESFKFDMNCVDHHDILSECGLGIGEDTLLIRLTCSLYSMTYEGESINKVNLSEFKSYLLTYSMMYKCESINKVNLSVASTQPYEKLLSVTILPTL
jgi:hypothetical protein